MSDVIVSLADEAMLDRSRDDVCGRLMFGALSHWKWQWVILNSLSMTYLHGVSPRFDTAEEAEKWMTKAVE